MPCKEEKMWLFLFFVLILVLLWWHAHHLSCKLKEWTCRYGPLIEQYDKFEKGDVTNNLFIKYGALQTVQAVVDQSVTNLLAEESLAPVFAVVGTEGFRNGPQLKACLDLFFSAVLGGPLPYPGKTFTRGVTVDARTMKASHRHLTISEDQFNLFNSVLIKTMLDAGVTQADVDSLTPSLNGLMSDIVTVV